MSRCKAIADMSRRLVLAGLLSLVAALGLAPAHAAGEAYDYDGLGRLIRVTGSNGQITEYQYDAAGNITAVISGGASTAPTATSVNPASLRRNAQARFTLIGTQLLSAGLAADDPQLTISRVVRAATSIAFDLSASPSATLGPSVLRVSSAAGSNTINVQIRPALPTMQVAPLPIAVAPGGRNASVDLVLSNPDDVPYSFSLSTARPDIAVTPASATIPTGSPKASFQVTGLVLGLTELRIESATLGTTTQMIFVTPEVAGITTAGSAFVGVELAGPVPPPLTFFSGAFAPLVNVLRGGTTWLDTSPRLVVPGSSELVTISGVGLPQGLVFAVEPPAGLTLGVASVAADGSSATVSISAAADAALGARRLVVSNAGVALRPFVVGADLLTFVATLPIAASLAPNFVLARATVMSFENRGSNANGASERPRPLVNATTRDRSCRTSVISGPATRRLCDAS